MKAVTNDTELIYGFQRGEERAVKEIYQLYYRSLCYFADKLLQNQTEAEDVAIDAFLKLMNKRNDFDSLTHIKSFLFTATRNACYDILRRNKRRDAKHDEIAYLHEPDTSTTDLEEITAKVLQVIYTEIENLPPQSKRVFTSIFIDGKSTAQIAEEMGISPQTVLNQKTKALQQLRIKLSNEGYKESGLLLYCLLLLALPVKG